MTSTGRKDGNNRTGDIARTVLVVDDLIEMRTALFQILTPMGYMCFLAENGDEAIRIFHENEISLVLLDLQMPGMSGKEVMRTIRETEREVIIILCSGEPEDEVAEVASEGADGYLLKPFSLEELQRTIARISHRQALKRAPNSC